MFEAVKCVNQVCMPLESLEHLGSLRRSVCIEVKNIQMAQLCLEGYLVENQPDVNPLSKR